MSEFSDWLTEQMATKGRSGSLRAVAERTGVAHNTVREWKQGKRTPSWFNCGDLADTFAVPREFVRRLAGYVDRDAEPYIAEATLRPAESDLLQAYRQGDAEQRHALEAVARLTGTISATERQLLEQFRAAGEEERAAILQVAGVGALNGQATGRRSPARARERQSRRAAS